MFTVEQRDRIRDELIAFARVDNQLVGAALVGSSATGLQDALSDIDIALRIAPGIAAAGVIDRWTQHITETYEVVHTLDVFRGETLYRVHLTRDSLQIDISYWSFDEFLAVGDRFKLLFGDMPPAIPAATPNVCQIIGNAWLYALHVRSGIARDELWHAQSILDDLRDFVLALACVRHEVHAHQLRGVDSLPADLLGRFADARSATLEKHELRRSLKVHLKLLLGEVSAVDNDLAARLKHPVMLIADY